MPDFFYADTAEEPTMHEIESKAFCCWPESNNERDVKHYHKACRQTSCVLGARSQPSLDVSSVALVFSFVLGALKVSMPMLISFMFPSDGR